VVEFKDGVLEETCRGDAAILPPLEELEEMVSSESWPWSVSLEVSGGKGGTESIGASKPFLVVADGDREPIENSPLALGAEATRRIKRVADALTDFGVRGTFVFERVGALEKECWIGSAE